MKIRTLFFALIAGIGMSFAPEAGAQVKADATYLYAQKGEWSLFMDIHEPVKKNTITESGQEKPTIIFMFGGGFIQGTRNDKSYEKWFTQMKNDGYRIVSIDYRLGLRGAKKVGIAQVNLLDKAIHMAVEDLFTATNFIIHSCVFYITL